MEWLDVSAGCEIDDESGVVTCPVADSELKVTATPDMGHLTVRYRRSFRLSIEQGVKLPKGFLLTVAPRGAQAKDCTVMAPVERVRCESRLGRTPTLHLAHSAVVEVAQGDWQISDARSLGRLRVDLRVRNREESVTVKCTLPVATLLSEGDHTYSLGSTTSAEVSLCSSFATLDGGLRGGSVPGTGRLVVKGDLADSTIELDGSLTVNGQVKECEIKIDGDIDAKQDVHMGSKALTCQSATVNGDLHSNSNISCQSLTVGKRILGISEIDTGDLKCGRHVKAAQIRATGDLTIMSGTECDSIECAGSVELSGPTDQVGELWWTPSGADARLKLSPPSSTDDEILRPLPQLRISGDSAATATPKLELGRGTRITRLRIEVPKLAIVVPPREKRPFTSGRREYAPDIGLEFGLPAADISVSGGMLQCSLSDALPEHARFNVDPDARIELSGLDACIADLVLENGGEVAFADSGPAARLQSVRLRGPTSLWSTAPIESLRMTPSESGSRRTDARDAKGVPTPCLAPAVVVDEASGGCVLGDLGGRINGVARPRRRKGTVQFAVHGIEKSLNTEGRAGHLTNVDVSSLDTEGIERLIEPRVLEISGRTVRRFASERTRTRVFLARLLHRPQSGNMMTRDEVRENAERAALLSDVVGRRVNSGDSRAWLNWAIARLQHRGLNRRAAERIFRTAFRMVGYGYRPGPAFLSWLGTAMAGLVYAWWNGDPANAKPEISPIAFDWTMPAELGEFMLLPIGYLRLANASDALVLTPAIADVGVRVLIGIPFLFLLLSLRQFFRSRAAKNE